MGVRRFSTLPYAHKPGVAAYLNDWSRTFAAGVPEVIWSGTFYPEDGRRGVRRGAGRRRRRAVQAAPAGGGVPPRRPAARRGVGAARGRGHAGRRARRLGAGRQRLHRARRRCSGCSTGTRGCRSSWPTWARPRWCGSCGWPRSYERVRLDTTMVFTDFFGTPYPDWLVPRAGRPAAQDPARHRLPDHPLPLRPPARGAGPPRPRRRLAAGGLLGERRRAVRCERSVSP